MYYLVYLPTRCIDSTHSSIADAQIAYNNIGRDYDEDYKVMSQEEYERLISI